MNIYFDPLLTVDGAHEDDALQRNVPRVVLESHRPFIQCPNAKEKWIQHAIVPKRIAHSQFARIKHVFTYR